MARSTPASMRCVPKVWRRVRGVTRPETWARSVAAVTMSPTSLAAMRLPFASVLSNGPRLWPSSIR